MTLAETKKTKYLTISGTFTAVDDLMELWVRMYPLGKFHLTGTNTEYTIKFKGDFYRALYVLGVIVEAVRNAKANCHLEVKASYEDE